MYSRFFSLFGGLAALTLVTTVPAFAPQAEAASRDQVFFQSVAGAWKGPGEIVAGKYKGTKFNCSLTGSPSPEGDTGIKLDGTCRVGVFQQPMTAIITQRPGYRFRLGQRRQGGDGYQPRQAQRRNGCQPAW